MSVDLIERKTRPTLNKRINKTPFLGISTCDPSAFVIVERRTMTQKRNIPARLGKVPVAAMFATAVLSNYAQKRPALSA
jgi:hypothetical protein